MLTAEKLEVYVGADTDEADRKLRNLGDGASSSGGGWAGKLARGGALAFAAVGAAAGAAGGWGLNIAMEGEQATIAFETVLGSAEEAQSMLGDLKKFAAETPFEFPGLRDAASRFLAVGLEADRVIPVMRTLGDATAAMGTGQEGIARATTALTQMQQKGKVTAEEMLQLTEAGIPAWDALAAKLGTDVAGAQKLVTSRQVEANEMFEALETSAGPALGRVSGMMEAQSATLGGMVSTLKDTLGMGLGDMMAPAVEAIKGQLPELTSVIGSSLEAIGPDVSKLVTGVVGLLGDLLPTITPMLGAVSGAIGDTFEVLGPALAEAGPPLLKLLRALLPILPSLAENFATLMVAALPLVEVLTGIVEAIPPDVLAGLITAFIGLKAVDSATGSLRGFLSVTEGAPSLMARMLPGLFGTTAATGGLGAAMGSAALAALPWIAAIAVIAGGAYLIYRNWGTISEFFTGLWESVSEAFTNGVAIIGDKLEAVVGWVTELPGKVTGALSGAGGWLVDAGAKAMRGLLEGLSSGWTTAVTWVSELPGRVRDAIGDATQMLLSTGKNVVIGLWNGLVEKGQWLFDKVWGWIKDVLPKPVKWALGIKSPSQVMAELGAYAGEGLAQGILGTAGEVAGAAGELARAAVPDIGAGAGMLPDLAGGRTGPRLSTAATPYSFTGHHPDTTGGSAPIVLDVSLELDGHEVARLLVDPMRGELIEEADRLGVDLFGGRA